MTKTVAIVEALQKLRIFSLLVFTYNAAMLKPLDMDNLAGDELALFGREKAPASDATPSDFPIRCIGTRDWMSAMARSDIVCGHRRSDTPRRHAGDAFEATLIDGCSLFCAAFGTFAKHRRRNGLGFPRTGATESYPMGNFGQS